MKNILIISEIFSKGGAGNASQNIFKFFRKNSVAKMLIPFNSGEHDKNILSYYNYLSIFYFYFIKSIIRLISYLLSNNNYFFLIIFLDFLYSPLEKSKELLMISIQIMY